MANAGGQAAPLLTKDSVNLFGHRLPLAVVGVVVGVAGLLLVLRARSRGGQVAAVGTPPSNPSAFDPSSLGNLGGAYDAQLANIQTTLGQLLTRLNEVPSAPPTSTLPPPPPGPPTPAPPGSLSFIHGPITFPPHYWQQMSRPTQRIA